MKRKGDKEKNEKTPKTRRSNVALILVGFVGLGLLLYPSLSSYWNSFRQTRAIADYEGSLGSVSAEDYSLMWESAREYNADFAERGGLFTPDARRLELYESLLNVDGRGMMGYIEIPSIRVNLPIYHGADDSVLDFAVGHIDWSSLPTGGENVHTVLSGHRGLPSAKLFTNLDRLREGDVFTLYILDAELTYEVDEIRVVEPEEAGKLDLIRGGDFCTLITCTPYGINTHRLLVRGRRIATAQSPRVTSEAVQIEPLVIAVFVAVPILILLIAFVLIRL